LLLMARGAGGSSSLSVMCLLSSGSFVAETVDGSECQKPNQRTNSLVLGTYYKLDLISTDRTYVHTNERISLLYSRCTGPDRTGGGTYLVRTKGIIQRMNERMNKINEHPSICR
jgi:hypothetical protein